MIDFFSQTYLLQSLFVLLLSGVVIFMIAPMLRKQAPAIGLIAVPNNRSSHNNIVPTSMGVAIFIGVILSLTISSNVSLIYNNLYVFIALAMLFVTGLIDDLKALRPTAKLLGQLIPAVLIVYFSELHSLPFNIGKTGSILYTSLNFGFWVFVLLTIYNAYNLIDGIDGLAVSLSIFVSLTLAILFIQVGKIEFSIISTSLCGVLIGALYYNFSSSKKMFIGDSGSLMIGGVIGFLVLKYVEAYSLLSTEGIHHGFFSITGLLFVPLADMLRVAIKRIRRGRSPFSADRTHLHHIIVDLIGGSHVLATTIILSIQVLVYVLILLYNEFIGTGELAALVLLFLVYSLSLNLLERLRLYKYKTNDPVVMRC